MHPNYFFACLLFFSLCLFPGCSPNSLQEFRCEGESISKELLEELQQIETEKELVEALASLQEKFNRLADVLICARKCQLESDSLSMAEFPVSSISSLLQAEIERVSSLEKGADLLEMAQKESLLRLQKELIF